MRLPRSLSTAFALVVGLAVLPAAAFLPADAAPGGGDAFSPLRDFTARGADVRVHPDEFAASRVDFGALRAELGRARGGDAVVSIPDPSGRMVRFEVRASSVMEDQLAAAHPEITTYAGRGVDDPRATIALDLTPMGFHASVRDPGGQRGWYVDPAYNRRGATAHLSYYGADLPAAEARRAEGEVRSVRSAVDAKITADAKAGQPVRRRYYRLALVNDPLYAAYFGTDNVLAEKITLINRVNQIYNDDFAATLRLINQTDELNFDTDAEAIGPDGPCGAAPCYRVADLGDPADEDDDVPGDLDSCSGLTLGQNRTVLGQLIGASNYDVGHIALGSDGGGVAYLGVIGGDYKGGGCTGLSDPKGDFFAIDYVAHEIGHQFGGNHTFNGNQWNCSGRNREQSASVEPGSGSGVMAYAGICRQDNLQPHSDPYFSQHTIDEYTALATDAPYDNIEVQTVSLRGFDTSGETIEIGYEGAPPVTISYDDYDAATLEAAVEEVTGLDVSIAEWGFDQYGLSEEPVEPDATGFQVIFNEVPSVEDATADDLDLPSLTVASTSAGVSGFVGETARGGKSNAEGSLVETTGNLAPVVTAPADRTIPLRTPFALTGSATDANGDPLTYLWEQNDTGGRRGTALVENAKVDGPLFRVFGTAADVSAEASLQTPSPGQNHADGNATRVFPDLAQILAGNTNALTGGCPPVTGAWPIRPTPAQVDCFSEFLPVPGYVGQAGNTTPAMKFRLTARDGHPTGGGTAYDDVTLSIAQNAGPFLVTSQNAGGTVDGAKALPVTWDVKGTNALAANVRISLSTDGGQSFPTVLAASTPNDGSQAVALPNAAVARARIKIEAVDNYFFDLNDADFAIAPGSALDTSVTSGPRDGAVVTSRKVKFAFAASEAKATFACTLDGRPVGCAAGRLKLKRAEPGTHVLSVVASDAAGNADPTPVVRTFTVPYDDGALKAAGKWRHVRDKAAYGGDYALGTKRGATLGLRVQDARRIVLVVSTAKGGGDVKVMLGRTLLKRVSTYGKSRHKVLKHVVRLPAPRSGILKIRVVDRRHVRIEGVAVVTR